MEVGSCVLCCHLHHPLPAVNACVLLETCYAADDDMLCCKLHYRTDGTCDGAIRGQPGRRWSKRCSPYQPHLALARRWPRSVCVGGQVHLRHLMSLPSCTFTPHTTAYHTTTHHTHHTTACQHGPWRPRDSLGSLTSFSSPFITVVTPQANTHGAWHAREA